MLYFDRMDISEGIDVIETSASKECDIYHYWCFLKYSFKFQLNFCNKCCDLLMMSMHFSHIAILNIKCSYYGCVISSVSKNEVINLMQDAGFSEKSGTL